MKNKTIKVETQWVHSTEMTILEHNKSINETDLYISHKYMDIYWLIINSEDMGMILFNCIYLWQHLFSKHLHKTPSKQ